MLSYETLPCASTLHEIADFIAENLPQMSKGEIKHVLFLRRELKARADGRVINQFTDELLPNSRISHTLIIDSYMVTLKRTS